jgi:hypothetical protein
MPNYYLSIETESEYRDRNPSTDKIITIQYRKLDDLGNPIGDLIVLKSWESDEKTILEKFMNICHLGNDAYKWQFIPIDNMINYSLLTIAHRLSAHKLLTVNGSFCDSLFYSKPMLNVQPIFIFGNNMSFKSGLKINEYARQNIPTLYKNKNYDEIVKIIGKKADAMIQCIQLFTQKIPTVFSNESDNDNISIPEEHQKVFEKMLETFPIYDVGETGCGHWTDCSGEENHSREIDLHEAADILEKIGIDIEQSEEEDGIPYHMIYDYTRDQGIPGLYLPTITYDYICKYLLKEEGE